MRFMVTGATGLVGSALCIRLAREGHEVQAVSRHTPDAGDTVDGITYKFVPGMDGDTDWGDMLSEIDCVIRVKGKNLYPGDLVQVKVTGSDGYDLIGRALKSGRK